MAALLVTVTKALNEALLIVPAFKETAPATAFSNRFTTAPSATVNVPVFVEPERKLIVPFNVAFTLPARAPLNVTFSSSTAVVTTVTVPPVIVVLLILTAVMSNALPLTTKP